MPREYEDGIIWEDNLATINSLNSLGNQLRILWLIEVTILYSYFNRSLFNKDGVSSIIPIYIDGPTAKG